MPGGRGWKLVTTHATEISIQTCPTNQFRVDRDKQRTKPSPLRKIQPTLSLPFSSSSQLSILVHKSLFHFEKKEEEEKNRSKERTFSIPPPFLQTSKNQEWDGVEEK